MRRAAFSRPGVRRRVSGLDVVEHEASGTALLNEFVSRARNERWPPEVGDTWRVSISCRDAQGNLFKILQALHDHWNLQYIVHDIAPVMGRGDQMYVVLEMALVQDLPAEYQRLDERIRTYLADSTPADVSVRARQILD